MDAVDSGRLVTQDLQQEPAPVPRLRAASRLRIDGKSVAGWLIVFDLLAGATHAD
jgi:hypothetical protein